MYATLSDYVSFLHPLQKNDENEFEMTDFHSTKYGLHKRENYTDIIHPRYFPPLYSFSDPCYSIQTHRFTLDEPIKPFHQQVSESTYGDQEIVLVTIPKDPTGQHKFHTDCCKLDAASYLKQDAIERGVSINGVFYQFQIDSVPLGGYKQGDKELVRDLQPAYRPFYRAITISQDGQLTIHSQPFDDIWKEREKYHSVMACAPLLINQGEMSMTDDLVEKTVVGDVHVLQCDVSKPHERGMEVQRGEKRIKSCSQNLPGGLFHSSNANPRSALITDKNGTVYFMRAAGRMPGVLGMDLVQMSQTIKRFIPDAWMAINLDGGAPSQILQKHNGTVTSTTNQYSHKEQSTILIGNLISYLKVNDTFESAFSKV